MAQTTRTAVLKLDATKSRQEIKSFAQSADKLVDTLSSSINVDVDTVKAKSAIDGIVKDVPAKISTKIDLDSSDLGDAAAKIKKSIPDSKTIEVDASVSKVGAALKSINFSNLGKGASRIGSSISDSIRSVDWRGLISTGLKTGAVAGAVAFSAAFYGALQKEASTSETAAALGLSKSEAAELGKVSSAVYANGWVESSAVVSDSIRSLVTNSLAEVGTTSQAEFAKSSKAALGLAKILKTDVSDVVSAASQLVKTGLAKNSTEAFDIIATGAQNGADRSGEFLDVIKEYAPNFAEMGFSGEQALGILVGGSESAVFQLDKVGDLIKEAGVKLAKLDTGKATELAAEINASVPGLELTAAGLQELAEAAKSGDNSSFLELVEIIKSMEDPTKKATVAAELLGAPFADLAATNFDSISFASEFEVMGGAAEKLGETLGDNLLTRIESLKRRGLSSLGAAAALLLPTFETVFNFVEFTAVPAVQALLNVLGKVPGSGPALQVLAGIVGGVLTLAFANWAASATIAATSATLAMARAAVSATAAAASTAVSAASAVASFVAWGAAAVASAVATAAAFTGRMIVAIASAVVSIVASTATAVASFAVWAAAAIASAVATTAAFVAANAPIIAIIAVIGLLVAGVVWAWNNFETFRNVVKAVFEAIVAAAGLWWSGVKIYFDFVSQGISAVLGFFRKAGQVIGSIFRGLTGGAGSWSSGSNKSFGSVIAGVARVIVGFQNFLSKAKTVFNAAKSVVSAAGSAIKSSFSKFFLNPIQNIIDLAGKAKNVLSNLNPVKGLKKLGSFVGLAKGGVTRAPTFAALSEYGHTEAIVPENASMSRIKDILGQTSILSRLHSDFASKMRGRFSAGSVSTTNVAGSNSSVVVNYTDNAKSASGKMLNARQVGLEVRRQLEGLGR